MYELQNLYIVWLLNTLRENGFTKMKYDILNIDLSWSALFKGFYHEMYDQEILNRNHIEFLGNPNTFQEWKKHTQKGYDLKVKSRKGIWYTVECKFTSTPVYPSWVERDWLSRDADIYVTDNKWNVAYEERQRIKEEGSKLMDIFELLEFLMKGNKLYYNYRLCPTSYFSDYKGYSDKMNKTYDKLSDNHSKTNLYSPIAQMRLAGASGPP